MFNAGFIGGMRGTAALKPLLMLFLLLVGSVTLSISLLSGQAHFQPDSASYVEQARSALEGKGFLSRGFSSDETGPGASSHGTKRPDFLFPPGYPIAIAVGSAISGNPADSVALWVTRISLLLLPTTIFIVLEPLGGIWAAFCIALVVGASPGAMHNGLVASSDMLSLLLTIVSFGAVLTAIAGDGTSPRYTYAFVGGLVGGLSYVTRNGNIALIASLSVSFAVALYFSPPSKRRELAGKAGLYAAGAALAIVR